MKICHFHTFACEIMLNTFKTVVRIVDDTIVQTKATRTVIAINLRYSIWIKCVMFFHFYDFTDKMLFNLLPNLWTNHFSQFITFHLEHFYLICIHLFILGSISHAPSTCCLLFLSGSSYLLCVGISFFCFNIFNGSESMTHAQQQTPNLTYKFSMKTKKK